MRVPLKTPQKARNSRALSELDITSLCVSKRDDRRWRYVITQDQSRTRSCPVPPQRPRGTTTVATIPLGVRKRCRRARKADSLLCEILIAGFWVATAAPGLLSLVSCMRSLMMACLSTEPAGAPGRLSGKSCGNWLFCRSSRISSKLSNSLPGCNKKKNNHKPTVHVAARLLSASCSCRARHPTTVTPAPASDASCKKPDVEEAHKVVERGLCRLPRAHLPCIWGAPCGTGTSSKPPNQDVRIHTIHTLGKGEVVPMNSVIGADSRDNLAGEEIQQR